MRRERSSGDRCWPDMATDGGTEPLGADWLLHTATREQLQFFEDEGYLIVPDALSAATVARLTDASDRLYADAQQADGSGSSGSQGGTLGLFRSVSRDPAILDLVDEPSTFPLLWDILGWNIQLYISHLIVYPPEPTDSEISKQKTTGNGWHIDGGRPVPEMEERPQPRLSLKVGYFLTDTRSEHSGAMRIVPRSHKIGGQSYIRLKSKILPLKNDDSSVENDDFWATRPPACRYYGPSRCYGYQGGTWYCCALRPPHVAQPGQQLLSRHAQGNRCYHV